ncbi:MAG: U32 family peptidase [Oscillospiraceae bacterium]|nr:U32 family peptidase [Oscillospiraceae bacterium]
MPEILAPAGSMEALIAAVRCGADAVYVGGTMYSARSSAANFDLPSLREASDICRRAGVKLHLAVNTLLTDAELPDFCRFMSEAGRYVDACIVQDTGVLQAIRQVLPEMTLHASTQMSIHTPAGAREAAALGCSRVVAAREMSRDDLAALCREPVEVEVFVHGALCMSVSGQCSFSALIGGRSANRGQCAQACRLPWKTPSGKNPAALSLRDLCLVPHMAELCEMGVDSFKIEGRMKRPEYVAAAVTALKQALNGEQPDLERLQAVFSRNGFTDGYFTGKKQNMFGFRRKEDVLAGNAVLPELAALYEKQPPLGTLDFSAKLQSGTPSVLTASDSQGRSVIVTGDIPEKAEKSPLTADRLARSLSKLGGTIYTAGETTLSNPDGLILTAAQCNALRRDAVQAMDALRIRENTPACPVNDLPDFPGSVTREGKGIYRVHVRTAAQLAAVPDGVICCIPLHIAETCDPLPERWIEAPRIIADEERYRRTLHDLHTKGYTHLLCHNQADIRLGREEGFMLHGGFGLNVTNRLTVQTLAAQGLQDVTGSIELRMRSLCRLRPEKAPDTGISAFVYGRLPMMLFRCCPIRSQDGCKHRDCAMTDRTGRTFPLQCSVHYQELLNANTLWLSGKDLSGLDYLDLYFTDEPPARIAEVLHAYRTGSGTPPEDRTGGLYEKGGLR